MILRAMRSVNERHINRGLLAAMAVVLGACGADSPEKSDGSVAGIDAGAPVRTSPLLPELGELGEPVTFLDLVAAADRAHVRREGPVLMPGGPGWSRVTRFADRSPWLAPTALDDRAVAWLDSIGGTLAFPVGPEGASMRTLQLWLHPVARGQVLSLFLDEQPLTTMSLKEGGHLYDLPLPPGGLSQGEHTLRFWYRFRRPKGRGDLRTPGALGLVRMVGEGVASQAPTAWVGELAVAGVQGRGLLAGPPTGWQFYLLPPAGARFQARLAVSAGGPVDFVLRVDADGGVGGELLRTRVARGTVAAVDVDLAAHADRPIRLSLDTEGPPGAIEQAAWLEPRILMPGLPRRRPPAVRNLLVWAVDGLRADRVGLGRGGDRAATPNLDLLAGEGAAAVDVWAAGDQAADGHRHLLMPAEGQPTLAEVFSAGGRRTGLISASPAIEPGWARGFFTRTDLRRTGERADTRSVLTELGDWLEVRGKEPFFLYLASDDPTIAFDPPPGYERVYRRTRPVGMEAELEEARERRDLLAAYDGRVSLADYWVGQLLALLQSRGLLDQTAVVVVGTVGLDLEGRDPLAPDRLQVPLVVWHPNMRHSGEPRPFVVGGDLLDVAATAVALVGLEAPEPWAGQDLLPALFHGRPLRPQPSSARSGNQVAARYGRWLMRGLGARDIRLWNLADDPMARDEISAAWPVALRVLRDSMLDRP